jgi:hypothetical protein
MIKQVIRGDCVKEPRLALAGTVFFALFLGVFTVASNLPSRTARTVAEGMYGV